MPYFAYMIILTVKYMVFVIQAAMFLRVIFSLLPDMSDTGIYNFAALITEPFLLPMRALFDVFGWFRGIPLDMSFMFTYMIFSAIGIFVDSLLSH